MQSHFDQKARDGVAPVGQASLKEWHSPVLKKLAIAATGNGNVQGNEGVGGGKGQAGLGAS
jgi:hypothetical protein